MVLEYYTPPSQLDLIRSPTTLQHGRYSDKELEQWHISFYTIVTNVNGSLEAVDCDIHSVRYDMVLEYCRPPSQLVLIRSPTTLQHGRYADKDLEQWHISFYTIITNVNGSLEAVDCDIHSARYDMVLEYCRPPSKLGLIRSPTTLQHGRYADKELEQWHISFYTIVTNVNGSLEAVDCVADVDLCFWYEGQGRYCSFERSFACVLMLMGLFFELSKTCLEKKIRLGSYHCVLMATYGQYFGWAA